MRVKVIGNGFIASHLLYNKSQARFDGSSIEMESDLIYGVGDEAEQPGLEAGDVVINCIGRCGNPNVDWCEDHLEETNEANTIVPIQLANICNENGIRFIHLGSGCIYNGWSEREGGAFCETDFANPQSHYAKTKYATDLAIAELPNTTILRLRMPISHKHSPRNFIDKVAKYKSVIDIPNSMTFVDDLVRCIHWVIQNDKRGIYNVVNPEPLTATDVMREYQKHKPDHTFDIMSGEQLNAITTAKRSNCILDGSKLANEGFVMTPSKLALEKTMEAYFNQ